MKAHGADEKCLFDSSSLRLHPLERFIAEVGEDQRVGHLILRSPGGTEIDFLIRLRGYSSTLTQLRPYVELELQGYAEEHPPSKKVK